MSPKITLGKAYVCVHKIQCSVYHMVVYFFLLFKVYFIDYAITIVQIFLPFIPLHPAPPLPPTFPLHLSSSAWVIHI